jgi:hypothetical protein
MAGSIFETGHEALSLFCSPPDFNEYFSKDSFAS